MSASLFDLYCLEVVPEHMAQVDLLYQKWVDAISLCIAAPASDAAQLEEASAARQAYEDALLAARQAFSVKWGKA